MRGTVIIFAKAPRAGAVKTRLAAEIGAGRAAALFRIMIERTIAAAWDDRWRLVIAVDPTSALTGWRHLFAPHIPRMAQGSGDLGRRMLRAMNAAPPGPVIIIGADAPGLRTRHLQAAFRALKRADAVFGPARDGGFWLVGLSRRRAAPGLFQGVRWSTPHALADSLKTLPPGFKTAMLEELADIDEAADLVHLTPRTTMGRETAAGER